MKKVIYFAVIITAVAFASCERITENNKKVDGTSTIDALTIWNDPAYFYYNNNIEKQQMQKAKAKFICTGYYIKNGEKNPLETIAFDSLDNACEHINNCITTFPEVTWIIDINGEPSNKMCNPV